MRVDIHPLDNEAILLFPSGCISTFINPYKPSSTFRVANINIYQLFSTFIPHPSKIHPFHFNPGIFPSEQGYIKFTKAV